MGPFDYVVLAFIASIAVLMIVTALVRRKELRVAGTEPCRSCGYSMMDAATDTCPECGGKFDASDGRSYCSRSKATTRSFAIVLMASASTFVAGQVELPTYGFLEADMSWIMQSTVGDSTSPQMRAVGRSSQTGWSSGLDLDVFPPLQEIEFAWEGKTLLVQRDREADQWVDAQGEIVDAKNVLARLDCTVIPAQQVDYLLTMNWSDGELQSFLETSTFDNPSDYGDTDISTVPHFIRNRYRFHYSGGRANLIGYEVGLYISWALIWIAAVVLIGLSFWVDRRKSSKKKLEATLPT